MKYALAAIHSPCTGPTAARLGGLILIKNLIASGANAEDSKRKNLRLRLGGRNWIPCVYDLFARKNDELTEVATTWARRSLLKAPAPTLRFM